MRGNLGRTTLKRSRRRDDSMREYDRLPPELRAWVATANLPWRPKSVHKAYSKALSKTGDPSKAIAALEVLQSRLVASDAARIWGEGHPASAEGMRHRAE
ncbi:hypothetical protein FIU97_18685 (plasmid) [Roseivivax sp. THAF40]|uniref:DUF6525 family protein n=1 Tax=unclassified Roseivivax TaxID=2639302 RepID=UPI001268F7DE|nr:MULTISPECIES: DUF6525 family protein [unclassified Roseivivax]QFS84918.1 hypothetical protein FIV09_18905 [Roseivivax sp. THAF197b]QFT48619.1 hypothetical protein FIU97_18685 [Roseivivax sp. THAF40]